MAHDDSHRIGRDDCLLMVIDLQGSLMPKIHEHERVASRCAKLIEAAKILGVPIVWTEQYRKGLGPTIPEIVEAIADAAKPLDKMTFGCLDDNVVRNEVHRHRKSTLILCGIEAHICVTQTALRGLEDGRRVVLAEDATSSRSAADRATALARLHQAGVIPGNFEMILMEWLRVSGTDTFKRILPLLKD